MTGYSVTSWYLAMDRVYEILADGEWHDREEVIAEVGKLVDREDALRAARFDDYWREYHSRSRKRGGQHQKWLDEHPTPDDYEPSERGRDPDRGRRQGLIQRINRDKRIETLRARATGGGLTMIRKRGEAAK